MRHFPLLIIALMTVVSCQKKADGVGNVSFKFPSAGETPKSAKVGSLSVDFAKVCYLANVTGGNLLPKKQTSCDIPFGIHTKFQLPDSAVSMMIPRQINYTLEIFAYVRNSASEACPSLGGDSLAGIDLTKLHRVGKTQFKVDSEVTTVKVDVTDPGENVVAQYSLPASCSVSSGGASGGPILVSTSGRRLYRAVDSSDGKIHTSTVNGVGLVLGKDGSR